VNGGSPTAIHRYSIPWDELPASWGRIPTFPTIISGHHAAPNLFTAERPVAGRSDYTISNPSYGSTNWTFSGRQQFCESIKVNQVGYSKRNVTFRQLPAVYMGNEGAGSDIHAFSPLPLIKCTMRNPARCDATGPAIFITTTPANAELCESGEYVYRLS